MRHKPWAGRIAEMVLGFVFPPRCPMCQAYVERTGQWCAGCLEKVRQVRRLPLSPALASALDGAWALGKYHGGLQNLIRKLKYQKKQQILPYLHEFLRSVQGDLPPEIRKASLAVPVPLFAQREKERGFNQAELIFAEWLQGLGVVCQRCLDRMRPTKPQYGLGAVDRAANVRDAFSLHPDCAAGQPSIAGLDVLLLDDIMTTGSTLHACAVPLKAAGAASVRALVLASDRE